MSLWQFLSSGDSADEVDDVKALRMRLRSSCLLLDCYSCRFGVSHSLRMRFSWLCCWYLSKM